MKKSSLFIASKRGTKGRRLVRHLDDAAVERAKRKSQDVEHQRKFMSRSMRQRLA